MQLRLFLVASVVTVAALLTFAARRATTAVSPEPPAPPRVDVDASAGTFAVELQSGAYKLRGDVMKPAGAGPFPAIVYNHGSERDPSLDTFEKVGEFFQAEGYVVLFPYRRGAGGSQGPYWADEVKKWPAAEEHEAVIAQLDAENDDVLAAIAWIGKQPYVDPTRIAVAGCSFGGIHTVLTAERSPAIFAAVDFAGASMSWDESPPLQERLKVAVRNARAPIFFLQAENDFNTTPSRVLSAEMTAASKPNAMKIFPPHGKTAMGGHAGFCTRGMSEWGGEVLSFLRSHEPKSR
jgi:carboxymethylenebutenolidase